MKIKATLLTGILVLFLFITLFSTSLAAAAPLPGLARTPIQPTANLTPITKSWIILDLPTGATQLEKGKEIYRLVCGSCHGGHGEGLTPAWISTWHPDDQNCWQSNCHNLGHPIDGFELPRYVPGVVGNNTLLEFSDGQQLYEYIYNKMPWHAPRTLMREEAMALTAFLLDENGYDIGQAPLDEQQVQLIRLRNEGAPAQITPAPTQASTAVETPLGITPTPLRHPSQTYRAYELPVLAAAVAVIVLISAFLAYRSRNQTP